MAGPVMVNHGAVLGPTGFTFDRTETDYMETAVEAQPDLPKLTLECWVQDFANPLDQYGVFVDYLRSWGNFLWVFARRNTNPALSMIQAWQWVGNVAKGAATWQSADVDALLAGAEPFHVAAVLDSPASLRLYVDGTLRATDSTDVPALLAGDYKTRLGCEHSLAYLLSGTLDEVRVSRVARYDANFTPVRLYVP